MTGKDYVGRVSAGRAAAVVLALSLAAAPAFPGWAEAADGDSVERTYYYMEDDGPESLEVPGDVEVGGRSYSLDGISEPYVDEEYEAEPEARSASRTVTVAAAEYAGFPEAHLPASIDAGEEFGDCEGELALDSASARELYAPVEAQVDRLEVYEGLQTNDVDREIPMSRTFEVSAGGYPGETAEAVLYASDIEFEATAYDAAGLPTEYRATVNYRGVEEVASVVGYEVAGSYSGDVVPDVRRMAVDAVFVAEAEEPAPAPAPLPEVPEPQSIVGWVVGAIAAGGGGIVVVFAVWWRRKAKVLAAGPSGKRVVARVAGRYSGGRCTVEIPSSLEAGEKVLVATQRMQRATSIAVVKAGRTVWASKPAARIRFDDRDAPAPQPGAAARP